MKNAILLIGPTGSGKSPLGDYLEANGVNGFRCHHFDFGENLRAAASGSTPGFNEQELAYLDDVLKKGALLENETFYIAEKILAAFCTRLGSDDLLILNGMPRHAGQAEMMANLVNVRSVLHLDCSPEVVCRRLESNAGGDRTERDDDHLDLVQKKLAIFGERTQPLLAWYQERGATTIPLQVEAHTQPADLLTKIQSAI